MNLNGKFIIPLDKNRRHSNKDLLNKNKSKLINIILSKKPISLLSNLKSKNISISHNIHPTEKEKGFSIKNSCLQKTKLGINICPNNIKYKQVQNLSNYKINRNKIKRENNLSCNNLKKELQNKNLYILNQYISNDIPNCNISLTKRKKYVIKNQKSESIRKLKLKKSKSISISRNLNKSGCSFERKKICNKSIILNNRTNCSYNGNNQKSKKYINKIQKNFSNELKHKISLFIEEQRMKSHKKILKCSNSHKNLNNIQTTEKNNTYGNITTNNSDKENTYFTTKKNNLTTHSNNMPNFTTNFNNSTNITETNNNELTTENNILKQKKIIKKKLGLPFHPNSKKAENFNQYESNNNLLIPYNKKSNNNSKIKRDNSPMCDYGLKNEKIGSNNSARNKNDSFFDLYKSINNNKSNNFFDSFEIFQDKNQSCFFNNNNLNFKYNEDDSVGAEMAHFRIVSFIQESKKLLK